MTWQCKTCQSWHFDYQGAAAKKVGMCRNSKILYAYCNPYGSKDDYKPCGVGRFKDDGQQCEEWRQATL